MGRIPAAVPGSRSTLWGQGFRVKGVQDLPEGALPRAHTCFFALDLPSYASQEHATARIRFAVRNCVSFQND